MQLAPDTIEVLDFAAALVNTVPGATKDGLDALPTPDALTAFLRWHRYSGRIDADRSELEAVHRTRDRLRRIWALPRDAAAVEVNGILRDAGALPYLLRHDGFDWHLHATDRNAPLAERIGVEVALAFVDVIRADEAARLRACAAPDCAGLLVDLSRNGSKRYCSVRCSNRMNMVAFRERGGAPARPQQPPT